MSQNPNTAILAGLGTSTQRLDNPADAKEAAELMVDAALAAEKDTGAGGLLQKLDLIISMSSMTPYKDPAGLAAEKLSARNARTVVAEVGTLQQAVFHRACQEIDQGAKAVLVMGGEAQYRALRSRITGQEITDTLQPEGAAPDETINPDQNIVHPLEIQMGLISAASHYALLENALGHEKGLSPLEQKNATAELWEGFNKAAAQNPNAVFPSPMGAEEIAAVTPKNRTIAAPYTKWNCSQMNVDYASALIFVSAELAEDLNIDKSQWIFPQAGAISNHMIPVLQRRELNRSQGFQLTGQAVMDCTETSLDQIPHIDLYSCFPAAVWIQAQEMGISISRQLTQTGGMTFGGGPLNSYVLSSLARTAQVLRENPKDLGLITSISGMISKQGVGVWSASPPEKPPQFLDISDEVKKKAEICEVEASYRGRATTVSSTMLYDREGKPEKAVCIADTENGKRTMAFSKNSEILSLLEGEDYLGRIIGAQVDISEKSEFSLL